ncbi:2OG-Fe(II) oxygenase [Kordiimonas gwangyangensis]|uniref:2OG-Fe(II) oxygenase n=1 Tax=Kordiimonas gwangyangensis TaxID=288022 RepID=UPI0003805B4C|nr:2OG-Fe(II) oxygenase family protein [Kordiimonas gwangyangensis]
MITIEIDTKHDPAKLAEVYKSTGRLQVPNFFTEETANALYDLISSNKTWFSAYNEGNNYYEVPVASMMNMPREQKIQFMQNVQLGARNGFQYFFDQYYMTEAIKNGRETGHPLHQIHDYVNSDAFLGFMRTLTGEQDIDRSDSFASQYLPGHFLTTHDDTHANENRVAAYTISMTKNWNPNWGGNLMFLDEGGNITGGFKPSFNTLNIFTVPQSHAVQHVAPFAGERRLSFLGWLKRP